jgi:hypothetical protein
MCLVLALLGQVPTPTGAHADAASPWTAGPNAVGDDTYSGFIDSPTSGTTLTPNSSVSVQGWVVDRTATGWTGIDAVRVYLGLQDQGGPLLAEASTGVRRDDVASALGNADFTASGFTASFLVDNLGVGPNVLSIYAHAPSKGWWYQQVEVRVPAPPDRAFADDPLLVYREAVPSLAVDQSTSNLVLRGYAIDRNMPPEVSVGVAGSGVSDVQFYLDGPRNAGGGTFLGSATLGKTDREATGFGQRFLMSGWEMTVHPRDMSVDRHAFFIYADSAYWPNATLVIVPFTIH